MNTCKQCHEKMVGSGDTCSDCAYPILITEAREAAAKAAEDFYEKQTGKRKSFNEICRHFMGIE